MMLRCVLQTLLVVSCLLVGQVRAFVPSLKPTVPAVRLQANKDGMNVAFIESKLTVAAAIVTASIPASVWAVVEDDYEYGKVDAPIGLAVGVGILAILTALLPVALRGGEEAFEEIRERDKESFGFKNDALKKKK